MTDPISTVESKVVAAVSSVVPSATADVAKAAVELSFVRANWGKLSIIVVAAAAVGFVVGFVL